MAKAGAASPALNTFSKSDLKFAASADKPVTFTCSSQVCVVSIQAGLLKTTFVGTGQMNMPGGTYPITYQVRGPDGTSFSLSAQNATMKAVNGSAPNAGARSITV